MANKSIKIPATRKGVDFFRNLAFIWRISFGVRMMVDDVVVAVVLVDDMMRNYGGKGGNVKSSKQCTPHRVAYDPNYEINGRTWSISVE